MNLVVWNGDSGTCDGGNVAVPACPPVEARAGAACEAIERGYIRVMTRAPERRHARSISAAAVATAPRLGGEPLAFAGGAALLVALVAVAFCQTGNFGILNFDDDQYLEPLVRRGLTWPGFVRAWTAEQVGNWHPLTTLSFMVDAQLFGDWWGGYHLHNVVLHAITAVVLFAALSQLTGDMGRSLVAAAVFAVHPLRAESVAWITERKDVLSGVFLATTLLAYAAYVDRPRSRWRYGLVVVSFTAGLLSKSMLVTLPLGLLVLDWWPLGRVAGHGAPGPREARPLGAIVLEKIPLLAMAVASGLITVLSVGDVVRPIDTLPFATRAVSSVVAYASYVIQLFWPVGLAPHYPYSSTGPTVWQMVASALFVAALSAAAWGLRHRWPAFATGWAWYLITLLPVVGFIPSGVQLIADRYTYVSQIWLVVAVVWAVAELLTRLGWSSTATAGLAAAGLMGLTWAGWVQTGIWRDSETLWRYTLAVTKDNAYAHANLGSVLSRKGEPVEAAEHNRRALELESDNLIALSNLATLLVERGGVQEAIDLYERSVKINPKFAFGWFNLGNALQKVGRMAEAESAWKRSVELNPETGAGWSNLAALALDREQWEEAIVLAGKAEAAHGGAMASVTLGRALERAARVEEATAAYRRAVAAEPRSTIALNNLGSTLERTGRLDEAAATFRRGLAIEPGSPILAYNLAAVLERQTAWADAAALFRQAEERFRATGNADMARAAADRAATLAAP